MVLGAVLDVGVVELRPEHIAAGGGGGEVAGEEQRQGEEERRPPEKIVPRRAGGQSLRRIDPIAVVTVDGKGELAECGCE